MYDFESMIELNSGPVAVTVGYDVEGQHFPATREDPEENSVAIVTSVKIEGRQVMGDLDQNELAKINEAADEDLADCESSGGV